jgi:RHS repeat-associated protein
MIFVLSWLAVIPPGASALARAARLAGTTAPPPASAPAAETFIVFGPRRFTRTQGAPVNVVAPFTIPADAVAPFSVLVENGDADGSSRVSSANIKLNGTDIFTSGNFNQTVGTLTKTVTLAASNTLEVTLKSSPGSYLTITITATRNSNPPAALSSVTPARATQGQTLDVTLHGTNTHWIAGQTRASLGGEVSVGGAAPGAPGPVTVTDANNAVAQVTISPTAALEPRTARVVTQIGSEEESVVLANAFTVAAAVVPGSSASQVSTIAGGAGQAGFADGAGNQARFRTLAGVAVGPDETIYVADGGNQRIRMVRNQPDASGAPVWTVSTLAGNGTAGFVDGTGSAARFNNPQGIAVDSSGVVYVADTANNRIRRIGTDGSVTTLAGDGTAGFQDGAGSQARFNAPQGIAVDNQGSIYVADTGNASVRAINSAGEVRTLAGDGTVGSNDSPAARFDGLMGVATDGANVYVYLSDTGNHRIRRLDPSGAVITIAGAERGFADGSASQSRFAEPSGIATDGSGKLIVVDAINSLVRLVDPNLAANSSPQAVVTLAGTGDRGLTDGAGDLARFLTPRGIAVSPSSAIVVADTGNQVLRRILLPPVITDIAPPSARLGDTVTINGARFDGRAPERNTVRFTRSTQAGGGQTIAQVTQATRTQLSVIVPADAATGPVTVQTEGGTGTSPSDFVVSAYPAPVISDFTPKHGPVGTEVTLTGTALKVTASEPVVTFAGANGARLPALVKSATATEVRVLVPNAALSGLIELTNAGGTATTSGLFAVVAPQDFTLTVAPSTATAVQGSAATYVLYLTSGQEGFSQLATLTATGLPAGVTASFDPAQITAGANSVLTLQLSGTLAPGSYPFNVRAVASVEGNNVTKTAGATLNVIAGGQTTLSGRVLSTDKEPIIGATVSLDGRTATTDAAGGFLLSGITAGPARPLMVDGRTASAPNRTYPIILEPAKIVAGQANVVPYTFYLPPIDTQYEVDVVPNQNSVAANPRVPNLQMTIPAGANLRNRDGSPVARVSITPLAIDRTPAPLPSNISTAIVYTSQPGGAKPDPGVAIPVVYPNLSGLNPNTDVPLYAFNHDTVQWYIYGTGRVSSDGRTIAPKINPSTGKPYGLLDFSWHFPGGSPDGNPGGPGGCPSGIGPHPVDYSTGIKIETATDISLGGARGSIGLSRVYSNDAARTGAIFGRFGRGYRDNYDIRLTGDFSSGGAGRVVLPNERAGRLFSYLRTDPDGALVFNTTGTVTQLGAVVRRLSNGTFEYKSTDGSLMRFDSSRQPVAIVDPNGNTTTLTYSGTNLTRITDPVGRSITLEYEGNFSGSRITRATNPLGHSWRYTYGAFGLETVTDPLNNVTRYAYDNFDLTSVTDGRGNVVKRLTYDGNGRVLTQTFADGGVERYDYSFSGQTITSVVITDVLGRKETKRFNASGYVIATSDALGQSSQIERDIATSLPTSTRGSCGCPEETRQFDARGNVLATTDKLGNTTRYEYEPVFNKMTKMTDKLGHVTTYTYDAKGNMTSMTDALNQTTTFGYDSYGELTSITDAFNHTTRYEYDAQGNQTAQIDPLGHRVTVEYDGLGRPTATVDALGRRATTAYDTLGRLTTGTNSAGAATLYTYDANNNVLSITNALSHKWTMTYDAKNRLTASTDPLGRVTRMRYDAGDQVISEISPSGRITSYTYDARGQRASITPPLGGTVRFTYDTKGNMTALQDQRGHTMTWTYDEMFRLKASRDPLGRETRVEYDAQANVKATVDRLGRRTTLSYDQLNRPQAINYTDAQVTYTYDQAGRIARIDDTQGSSVELSFDEAGRLLAETTAAGRISYEYNAANQRTKMTAANKAPVVYTYDAAGRPQTITQGTDVFTYGYDTVSRRASLQRPNGVATTYSYDEVNRLTRMTHGQAGAIEDYRYEYTADNEIAAITSVASATQLPGQKTFAPADAANRISQAGAASYAYNDEGKLTSRTDAQGTTNFQWDARGRMISATLPSGQSVSYGYDALGRRASRTAAGETATYLSDGLNVVSDKSSNGSETDYLHGLSVDEHLRQSSAQTGALYFIQDHLGSTSALTNGGGQAVERFQYEAFGAGTGSALTRYGYTGREFDSATNLYYYRNRWYDPHAGRFVSEDPIGIQGGFNLYAYVKNNPLSLRDPNGLDPVEVIIWNSTVYESFYGYGGHVSYNIDGVMWSWEGNGWNQTSPAQSYIDHNRQFRSGMGYVIDLGSPEKNEAFKNAIKNGYDGHGGGLGFPNFFADYNLFNNNCGEGFRRATGQLGLPPNNSWTPWGHRDYIENDLRYLIRGRNFYPYAGSPPGTEYTTAPGGFNGFFNKLAQDIGNLYGYR